MNLFSRWRAPSRFLFRIGLKCRRLLPKRRVQAFGHLSTKDRPRIERIYAINLDRQPTRWIELEQELRQVLDFSGTELWALTKRYSAVDANDFTHEVIKDTDIDPIYTLGEQLFVEPQPQTRPSRIELNSPIRMSRPEVAVARSHINVWREVAAGEHEHVLILEDDVLFHSNFASQFDQAWGETKSGGDKSNFDIFYLSYAEVKHGAPKTFLSDNVFRPARGLWHLSGYILSREGAKKLLQLLPCRGPVDLWINHQFGVLDVRATRRSIINQRRDTNSTNSYSVLPALTKIGAITSEGASLFHVRPSEGPVFAFGPGGSGLTSLAMALSMLGYRCCSDLQSLPESELERLLTGNNELVFDAYVNIGSLAERVIELKEIYPKAKFIFTKSKARVEDDSLLGNIDGLKDTDFVILHSDVSNKWQVVCEHLSCVPPTSFFPELKDLGQRPIFNEIVEASSTLGCKIPKRDKSPWIVEPVSGWQGIQLVHTESGLSNVATLPKVIDCLESLDTKRWFLRDDTFTGNLALFRSSNIEFCSGIGALLTIKRESLGVREYSAAAITSSYKYLFGRFEAVIRASNVPGTVTGFFLHRDSPRQEIDFEITGNRPDRVLVNVFYNPGGEGAKFDYGYRGAASYIDLGFNASESSHRFAIEWGPREIRWFVDDRLIHKRTEWEPTPIPHLPMALHVNTWPSNSKELAGRLTRRRLPATTLVSSITVEAHLVSGDGIGT